MNFHDAIILKIMGLKKKDIKGVRMDLTGNITYAEDESGSAFLCDCINGDNVPQFGIKIGHTEDGRYALYKCACNYGCPKGEKQKINGDDALIQKIFDREDPVYCVHRII